MINELKTIEEYESFVRTNPLAIIHFWAEWNHHDIVAKNILNNLVIEFEEKIAFASLDTDQEHLWDLIKSVGVKGLPAFSYFKNGNQLAVEVGLRTKEGFHQRLKEILS